MGLPRCLVLFALPALITSAPIARVNPEVVPSPDVITSHKGHLNVTLTMGEYDFTSQDGAIKFRTRAYNGQIPGPTLSVRPGDTMHITVANALGFKDPPGPASRRLLQATTMPCTPAACTTLHGRDYYEANTTNLHTHGLHVSSALGSDNVLAVKIKPGYHYQYEIKIPENHMPGTFWYHPHFEGSTAVQVILTLIN